VSTEISRSCAALLLADALPRMVLPAMDVTTSFWLLLAITLTLLGVALVSGLRRKRRLHLWAGPATLLSLTVTIWLAEQLGRRYLFPPEPMRIHLVFAISGGCLAALVGITGLLLWRSGRWRRLHRWTVFTFVAVALVATGTGVWIWSLAVPR